MAATSKWRSILAISSLLCSLSCIAAPQPWHRKKGLPPFFFDDLSSLQVPLTNGQDSLPPPTGTLKAVSLGVGTQNYSCDPSQPSTTPSPIGAKAALFDLSPFLPWAAPFLPAIPGKALDLHANDIASKLSTLGHHIFNAQGSPCFHLGQVGDMTAKKLDPPADIKAPADSSAGKTGVDWLKLGDKGGSEGVSSVYRVYTAGGKPPASCDGQEKEINVPYTALYWFYEGS